MSERVVDIKGNENLLQQSIKRYNFAKRYCSNRKVVDIGSGEGYGSNLIANKAILVVAVDYNFETVKQAKNKYKRKNLYFICADCYNLPFKESCFDTATSFEVIEHLDTPVKYLKEICRVISGKGVYIGSTPQVPSRELDQNPFHKHPYSKDGYSNELSNFFHKVEIFGEKNARKISKMHLFLRRLDIFGIRNRLQNQSLRRLLARLLGSTPFEDVSQKDFIVNRKHLEDAQILVAVAAKPKKGAQRIPSLDNY